MKRQILSSCANSKNVKTRSFLFGIPEDEPSILGCDFSSRVNICQVSARVNRCPDIHDHFRMSSFASRTSISSLSSPWLLMRNMSTRSNIRTCWYSLVPLGQQGRGSHKSARMKICRGTQETSPFCLPSCWRSSQRFRHPCTQRHGVVPVLHAPELEEDVPHVLPVRVRRLHGERSGVDVRVRLHEPAEKVA